jgi:DNA-binding response OmpR family regulator
MQTTILVVDDHSGQRVILDMLLTLDGYEVVGLQDGREALEYLRTNTPSLVVLDVNMPFMSGTEICSRMRRIHRLARVPVIILTAMRDEKTLTEARLARADAVISKPLEGKDFRALVKELLEARQAA